MTDKNKDIFGARFGACRVVGQDKEFPELVDTVNVITGQNGSAIADFVRQAIADGNGEYATENITKAVARVSAGDIEIFNH